MFMYFSCDSKVSEFNFSDTYSTIVLALSNITKFHCNNRCILYDYI